MTATLTSERVQQVLVRLHERARIEDPQASERVRAREAELGIRLPPAARYELYGDAPLSITKEVGELYHVLVTTRRAGRVVEYGSSHGISTIYLACALRDLGGGGRLVTTEILPGKARSTRQNVIDAGLEDIVDVREGDARDTLAELEDAVDVLVLDGRNDMYIAILELVGPRLAPNALVIADLGYDPDLQAYQRHVRRP